MLPPISARAKSRSLSRDHPLAAAFHLLRPRLPRLALAAVLGVFALGSALALAGVSAWLITRAWQMPPVLDLAIAVVTVRALGISRGVLGYCERLASHDTALRAAGTARTQLYRRLSAAPVDAVLRMSSGALVSRIGASVDEVADVLVRAALPIVVSAILSSTAVAVIAVISPVAALVLACCLLVAGVAAPLLVARATAATELIAVQHHSLRDTAAVFALEHAPELRVSGRLDGLILESDTEQRNWGRAADRAALPAAIASAAPTAAVGVSVLGALIAAITLAQTVSPTTLAILMLLPLSAFEASAALPQAAIHLTRARIAAIRLAELTDSRPLYRERPVVTDVDLQPGDRLAVIGPSGSGKTTLLMMLAERYESPLTAGLFAEDAHLFATTVRDNLLVARGDAGDDELTVALDRVGLREWLDGLPHGLSTVLIGGAAAVSAGQRRRLLLARALISRLPIVLLDEPTEHLDAATSDEFLTGLLTPGGLFAPDRTVVVVTHHLPEEGNFPILRMESAEYSRQA
jgi:ATP-binding cassette subfamily C protein CydC